jgi:peroxiredoxin Q/BCP
VWQKKKMMGREYMGTRRMSFLINPEGKIAKVYGTVDPAIHAKEVLADLGRLGRGRL